MVIKVLALRRWIWASPIWSIDSWLDNLNVAQQELNKDILGKVLVTVSALCLITVAALLIWGFVLD